MKKQNNDELKAQLLGLARSGAPRPKANARRYRLTTEHSASSYGLPVLVDSLTGEAYGVADINQFIVDGADGAYERYCRTMEGIPLVPPQR